MEFENITVTDKGVVRLKRITIVIPFFNDRDKEIETTTSNRELIHIAINRQVRAQIKVSCLFLGCNIETRMPPNSAPAPSNELK